MRQKIFRNMCLTALATVVVCALLTTLVYYADFEGHMEDEVREEAAALRPAVEELGADYLEDLAFSKNRLTLIDEDGTVLFDNQADPAAMENHLDRPEVADALEHGAGEETRMSDTLSEQTFYYAVRLGSGQVLRMAVTTDTIFAAMLGILPWLIASALAAVAVTALLSNYLTKKIVAPINRLDLDHPDDNFCYEELSPLLPTIS